MFLCVHNFIQIVIFRLWLCCGIAVVAALWLSWRCGCCGVTVVTVGRGRFQTCPYVWCGRYVWYVWHVWHGRYGYTLHVIHNTPYATQRNVT